MSIKGKYSESTPLYAALMSVGAVAAIAVFAVVMSLNPVSEKEENGGNTVTTTPVITEEQGYNADDELAEEMKDAAQALVSGNYEVLSLYYIYGLDHKDEPYGNAPEDNLYTVKSDEYSSLTQLEAIVDNTFVPQQAAAIKGNSLGYGPIYATRSSGELGITANFTPMPYEKSWENPRFTIDPVSDTECILHITITNREDGSDSELTGEMIKTEDGWRLKTILF